MYIVPIEIKESQINGKGVFTTGKIFKGKMVWKFDSGNDKTLSIDQFNALDNKSRARLERIAYLSPSSNRYVYPSENDPARFTNHSTKNNLSVVFNSDISEEPYFVANRDIQIGEELTNNYLEFDKKENPLEWIKE